MLNRLITSTLLALCATTATAGSDADNLLELLAITNINHGVVMTAPEIVQKSVEWLGENHGKMITFRTKIHSIRPESGAMVMEFAGVPFGMAAVHKKTSDVTPGFTVTMWRSINATKSIQNDAIILEKCFI